MLAAQISIDEKQRSSELYRYNIIDTPPEEAFNKLALLASHICKTPISAISFIDGTRHWVKAVVGIKKNLLDRNLSFFSHATINDDLLEIKNALRDKDFCKNPLVKQNPKIRFFACFPLITLKGYKIGVLCVADTKARKLSKQQSFSLKMLSKQIIQLLELRMLNKKVDYIAETQQQIISVISHDIRSPLHSIKSFLDLLSEKSLNKEEQEKMFSALNTSVNRTLHLLDNLVEWGKIQLHNLERNEVLNLKDVVQECVEQAELNIIIKQNKIINDVNNSLINADKQGIQFILRNLISNANKFTENGTIKISSAIKNGKCFISVKDSGVGIEMDKVNVLLKNTGMFHTIGTQNEKGSGLGLSLIKSYLNKTENNIEIKSILREGTSVSFSISSSDDLITVLA